MAINKVIAKNKILIDLTSDTATENDVIAGKTFHLANGEKATGIAISGNYAGSPSNGGNANCTNSILYGSIDSTSTENFFTATIEDFPGFYSDGVTVLLKNKIITSSANFSLNINNLGALPVIPSLDLEATQNPIFKINTTMLFVLDLSALEIPVDNNYAAWICYQGEDSFNQEITMTEEEVDMAINAAWSNGGN